MKLLKYVVRFDSGVAPNPYFNICSLALCTPNHRNAQLKKDDWILGHSSKSTGQRLIYAMKVTKVLPMVEYFHKFREKQPDPLGTHTQQRGDNMYYQNGGGRWARLPSTVHNTVEDFEKDRGKKVYLAEGAENYWYFGDTGPDTSRFTTGFSKDFPELVWERPGFKYVRDNRSIENFVQKLKSATHGKCGLIGSPRDQIDSPPECYLVGIDPEPVYERIARQQSAVQKYSSARGCRHAAD